MTFPISLCVPGSWPSPEGLGSQNISPHRWQVLPRSGWVLRPPSPAPPQPEEGSAPGVVSAGVRPSLLARSGYRVSVPGGEKYAYRKRTSGAHHPRPLCLYTQFSLMCRIYKGKGILTFLVLSSDLELELQKQLQPLRKGSLCSSTVLRTWGLWGHTCRDRVWDCDVEQRPSPPP